MLGAGDWLAPIAADVEAYLAAGTAAEALEQLGGFRVLCAHREGRAGAAGLNAAVERWLRARFGTPTRSRWYDGRPVLVTENDPAAGLFNGDVGVARTEGGRTRVHFAALGGGVRAVPPARLPAHETAWAMTVHKAQGSEFERVVLVLPDVESRVLTRELLYTGVTRARSALTVVGRAEVLAAGTGRGTVRASGLAGRVGGGAGMLA